MIKAEDLCFTYDQSKPCILNHLYFTINDGEYVSILGENGSGKTTLLRLMLGFIKPNTGYIKLNTNNVGYVPQKSEATMSGFPITVYELLDSYRHLLKINDKSIINNQLSIVKLEDKANTLIGDLSGGQQQKVMITRALMGNPDILILDEPSTGIDVESQKDIYRLIKHLNQHHKITVIAVEHNIQAAITYSSIIYHLAEGKGHFCDPKKYTEEYERKRIPTNDNI